MRPSFRPHPGAARLPTLRVHEVVRDYPETLPLLEGMGIDLGACGGRTLAEVLPQDRQGVARLLEILAWRAAGSLARAP